MKIAELFRTSRDRLTRISEKEPLSFFSLFLILLFDIFVFSVIASGLSDVTKNVDSPDEYASYNCIALLDTDKIANETDRQLAVLTQIRNHYDYGYSRGSYLTSGSEYGNYGGYGKGCEPIRSAIESIYSNQGTESAFWKKMEELSSIEKLISANEMEQQNARSNYDTKLLEKMANQEQGTTMDPGTASDLATKVANLQASSGALVSQKESIIHSAYALPEVQGVVQAMKSDAEKIRSTHESLVFWYPVKTFGMQLVFLLPLLAIVVVWVRRSIVKNAEVQSLVGSHVVAVISIFGLMKVIEFVYDILPKKLIEEIIAFLEKWNIIQLWYYILVLLGIAACLGAIYVVQKKILSPRKQEAKRVAFGGCRRCGTKRVEWNAYCINCGTNIFTKCPVCKHETIDGAEHCGNCGELL